MSLAGTWFLTYRDTGYRGHTIATVTLFRPQKESSYTKMCLLERHPAYSDSFGCSQGCHFKQEPSTSNFRASDFFQRGFSFVVKCFFVHSHPLSSVFLISTKAHQIIYDGDKHNTKGWLLSVYFQRKVPTTKSLMI